jgi:hypothetical protein
VVTPRAANYPPGQIEKGTRTFLVRILSIVLDLVSNPSLIPMHQPSQNRIRKGSVPRPSENLVLVSTIRESVVCPICHLNQFERGSGRCRRCQQSLGVNYIEIFLPNFLDYRESKSQTTLRIEAGALMRRLRLRHGVTQAALSSLTGITDDSVTSAVIRGAIVGFWLSKVELQSKKPASRDKGRA